MHWNLALFAALWWAFIGAALAAARLFMSHPCVA